MAQRFDEEIESKSVADEKDYPVMPLRNTVLFPQQVIPIYIGREKSLKLIDDLGPGDKHIVVVAQEDGSIEDPEPENLYAFGTLGVVLKVFDMPDNSKSAIVQGVERVKLLSFGEPEPYYTAVVERIKDNPVNDDLELDALAKNLRDTFTELIQVAPNLTEEHSGMLSNIQKPSRLADRAVSLLTVPNQEKQEVLEELEVKIRVEKTITLLTREIQRIKLGEEIQTEVHDEISKTQREYYLREQMKAIKRELGEDEETVEIKELEDRIKAAGLPEDEVRELAASASTQTGFWYAITAPISPQTKAQNLLFGKPVKENIEVAVQRYMKGGWKGWTDFWKTQGQRFGTREGLLAIFLV